MISRSGIGLAKIRSREQFHIVWAEFLNIYYHMGRFLEFISRVYFFKTLKLNNFLFDSALSHDPVIGF